MELTECSNNAKEKNAGILELGHGFNELTAGEDFTRSIFICSGDFSL